MTGDTEWRDEVRHPTHTQALALAKTRKRVLAKPKAQRMFVSDVALVILFAGFVLAVGAQHRYHA